MAFFTPAVHCLPVQILYRNNQDARNDKFTDLFEHMRQEEVVSVQSTSGATNFQSRRATTGKKSGRQGGKSKQEKLWQDLFADSSNWWDNRVEKQNARFPDFKHKQTGEGLWLGDGRNPPWVESKIVSLTPGVSIFSSTQLLSKFNKDGQYARTLQHFEKLQQEGILLNAHIFVQVLNACAALHDLEEGRLVHKLIVELGCENVYVYNSLVDMYVKCGSLQEGQGVFNNMPIRTVISWTIMIVGHINCGEASKGLMLYEQMRRDEVVPDRITFVALLNACATIGALEEGRRVHKHIVETGCEIDIYVCNSLLDMYAKCGSLKDAHNIFDNMFECNARASLESMKEGGSIHRQLTQTRCEIDVNPSNSLLDMSAKCASLQDNSNIFRNIPTPDVVSWTVMIRGHVSCGEYLKAIHLFQQMELEGVKPDRMTFVAVLNACASVGALEAGKHVHRLIIETGSEFDPYVCNSLVDMYSKCRSLQDAQVIFEEMPTRDVVSWTTMMQGFVNCGEYSKAPELFQQMQLEGVEPNSITFGVLLNAYASMAALEGGRYVHQLINESGCHSDVKLSNSLVHMYAKCGSIQEAQDIFNTMPSHDVVSWTTMIMGYAIHGLAKEAVALFEKMSLSGAEINEVTFTCLLSACSHGGLVKIGVNYFESMSSVYGISPTQEHYACLVDILGRAGHLSEAEAVVKSMPFEPSARAWNPFSVHAEFINL